VLNASTSSAQLYHDGWPLIAGPSIIDGFIDYLAISMRGLLAGRVSGRLLYPGAEMFTDMPYYLRIGSESDDLHLPSIARTGKGVHLLGLSY